MFIRSIRSARPGSVAVLAALFAAGLVLAACAPNNVSGRGRVFQGGGGPGPLLPPPGAGLLAPSPPIAAGDLPPVASGAQARVGLLLPLSGTNAGLGRALLDAAQLAIFEIADPSFVLLPRDTGGTPDGAAAAAQVVMEQGAQIILGPLFAAEAGPVAAQARQRGVNVVSFSNDRTVAQPGVFLLGITPQTQVERVVGFARSRGQGRFAALVPSNAFGAAVEDALRRTAVGAGGDVVAIERYEPNGGDVANALQRLTAVDPRRARAARPGAAVAAPASDLRFDTLLLPDSADRVLLISPQLASFEIDAQRVRFLGTALWDDPRIARDAALAGGWYPAPTPEARLEFISRYKEVYGRDPPRIATLAYDAVALAAVLAKNPRGPDFSGVALTNPSGFDGIDGIFRFLPDGTNQRGLAVYELRREGNPVVSPGPSTFQEMTR